MAPRYYRHGCRLYPQNHTTCAEDDTHTRTSSINHHQEDTVLSKGLVKLTDFVDETLVQVLIIRKTYNKYNYY